MVPYLRTNNLHSSLSRTNREKVGTFSHTRKSVKGEMIRNTTLSETTTPTPKLLTPKTFFAIVLGRKNFYIYTTDPCNFLLYLLNPPVLYVSLTTS